MQSTGYAPKPMVAAQLINTRIRLLGHELKVREVEELERRLEELESYNRSGYYG